MRAASEEAGRLYDLYNLGQQRRFERYQYALKVLERPMDFTGNDNFNLDRSKAPWPKDEAELNKLWDAKVKFDQLSLKLAGKDDKEIRDTLTRRYKFAIRRLAQNQQRRCLLAGDDRLRSRNRSAHKLSVAA